MCESSQVKWSEVNREKHYKLSRSISSITSQMAVYRKFAQLTKHRWLERQQRFLAQYFMQPRKRSNTSPCGKHGCEHIRMHTTNTYMINIGKKWGWNGMMLSSTMILLDFVDGCSKRIKLHINDQAMKKNWCMEGAFRVSVAAKEKVQL